MSTPLPDWAYAYGPVTASARIREAPEDFRVEEVLGFAADGDGPHRLLTVDKRNANTRWVAGQLARLAGVPARDIGFAGLKDRKAVALQHFTVPLPRGPEPDWMAMIGDGFRVVAAAPHRRKLHPGALKGNRFRLVLRHMSEGPEGLSTRLEAIHAGGVPNYFGEQRFGRGGSNLARAEKMFAGARIHDRKLRGLLLSSARSVIFNQLLSQRVQAGNWDRLLPGEVLMLDGSHSVFSADPADGALSARISSGDVHPTGPLWGNGELRSREESRHLDEQAAAAYPLLADGLVTAKVEMARRALRLPVRDFEWTSPGTAMLELKFFLPAGAFATAVLRELVRTEVDEGEDDADAR